MCSSPEKGVPTRKTSGNHSHGIAQWVRSLTIGVVRTPTKALAAYDIGSLVTGGPDRGGHWA